MDSSHSAVNDGKIKTEPSSRQSTAEPSSVSRPSLSANASSADFHESSQGSSAPKKKGTAAVVKKTTKRPKSAVATTAKKAKREGSPEPVSDDEGSDGGPYCLCRGTDDHRWMICCEFCDDWFHGECINLSKEVGENLIEKFVCPNCTDGELVSIYKKTCSIPSCKKPARLAQEPPSYFCSNDHAQTWWERMVSRLPKDAGKSGLTDQLTQGEFMALLNSGMSGLGNDGTWKLAKNFFGSNVKAAVQENGDSPSNLSSEERLYVEQATQHRQQIEDETVLCHKMLSMVEMARERRRAAIKAGKIGEDICGYDQRLDSIMARDVFAAFVDTPEGQKIFESSKLEDPLGEGDEVRGMCEKKRCKPHQGWNKVLQAGVERRVQELASQAAEVAEDERIVREAAAERFTRKQAEKNWVEVLDG